jgi:hypothetical protein
MTHSICATSRLVNRPGWNAPDRQPLTVAYLFQRREHDHTNGCPILAALFAARVGTLTFLFQKEDRRESGRAALQRRVKHPTHNRASAPDGPRGESLAP